MEIIPVIDIKAGRAVHARQGLRDLYEPLDSELCPQGDPFALASSLLSRYPFRTIYLADLDALMNRGSNLVLIQELASRFPGTRFWVDQGLSKHRFSAPEQRLWVPVIGSESLTEKALPGLALAREGVILSLDFSASGFIGPKTLLENERYWPERVILMDLGRVGAARGPNWKRLEYFRRDWPMRRFIAAGGVRHENDLQRLASLGCAGALIATALHRNTVRPAVIERLMAG